MTAGVDAGDAEPAVAPDAQAASLRDAARAPVNGNTFGVLISVTDKVTLAR